LLTENYNNFGLFYLSANFFSAVGFQGLTAGISDPTIFKVPDVCNSAQTTVSMYLD